VTLIGAKPPRRCEEPAATDWLVGGGELGALIRAKDWSATPLGPVERWPQSLRSAVSILLPSRAQICLFWGPQLVAIYNDAYRPALGVKHPWALGRPACEVWSEFWDEVLRPLLEGVLDTGEAFWARDHPFFLERHGYPEETYFDISYDPVRVETGRVGGVFCIVAETTGRVLGERRLRMLRELGRVPGEARSVGEAFRQAAAILEDNPYDIAFAVLFDGNGAPAVACRSSALDGWPLAQAARSGELLLGGEALRAFGRLAGGAWSEPSPAALVLPMAVPGRPPYGFLVAGVSPRLELDEAYRDFLRLVATSIASALAAALALEAERARAEALADIDRAKTAFFSNVSHEFRTPLTLMLGPVADLLEDRSLAPAHREALERVRRNSLRLLKLVNTLLDFSRLEAGRAAARYEPVDLAAFTAELASNFRSACEKAGLALTIDCPPLQEPAGVDTGMWEKIVLNLLSNALKFTFEGAIEVALVDDRDSVHLQVRDTGIGIAAPEIPRVFERFHRVEGTRARTYEGSGIGLALVQELVRLHGGEIRVESEPGRGSRFTVTLRKGSAHLPQERVSRMEQEGNEEAPAPAKVTQAASYVEEALAWLGAEPTDVAVLASAAAAGHVIVVDDNPDMLGYVARLLRGRWRVTAVADARAALEALRRERGDLVVSDVMMPGMDGFALLHAIKSDPALADTPVVLLSARAGEESRIEGYAAGADDYIVKPFSAAQLIAQVNAQLTVQRTRRESARERERLLERERAAKREAQLQREHLYALFMQAPNPVVILRGSDYVIELANPPACRVWGRSSEDVVGRPLLEALPEVRTQVFKSLLDHVVHTGRPYQGKEIAAELDRRGGDALDTVYLNFVYTPLRGVAGEIEGVLVTAFDVTDEVVARQEMGRLRAEAEAASRTKDEFLAMLSHELRNPLAPILATLRLLRLSGRREPELDILERQAGHLTRLVDDLLDVSRITRGMIELRRRRIELAEAVDKALEIASPLIEERAHPVDMTGVVRRGLPVDADPERLAQVISNLLTNAAKYSEPGSPITVATHHAGECVRVLVSDEGVGIAPDMAGRIFESFVQQPQTI
jgi:PAS domain S-box-containing protein